MSAMLAEGAADTRFEVGGLEKFPLSVVLTVQDNAFFGCSRRGVHLLREADATLGGRVFPLVLRFYLVPELNVLSVEAKHPVFRSEEVLCALYAQDWGREITLRERFFVQARDASHEKVFLWTHFYAGHHSFGPAGAAAPEDGGEQAGVAPFEIPVSARAEVERAVQEVFYDPNGVSSYSVMARLNARLAARCVLLHQVETLKTQSKFAQEINAELKQVFPLPKERV